LLKLECFSSYLSEKLKNKSTLTFNQFEEDKILLNLILEEYKELQKIALNVENKAKDEEIINLLKIEFETFNKSGKKKEIEAYRSILFNLVVKIKDRIQKKERLDEQYQHICKLAKEQLSKGKKIFLILEASHLLAKNLIGSSTPSKALKDLQNANNSVVIIRRKFFNLKTKFLNRDLVSAK
jgi:hypothetical protein